ncbi:LacI family DNA-binding transcriptional regulator [Modestobacter sp. VKM Ac-2978]|uniref:LacI family DNA-binding transcriptional regulator n=1 Tax=Modestobacter sp. VKM Ac-2978 TaxID=3004132 RepID=UPI0022AA3326|nr:LacI family DNA-binding transcriptional regulator [Modestobacter sp. VKM Ac-2978]MCZ2849377.1 LacI family DNA-binding transcriptional regulator [Modestobacter sp. VKM Ac-2978]
MTAARESPTGRRATPDEVVGAPVVRRSGPVLLSEVAAHAGVSLATASRVLSGSRSVGEPHRGRVLAAAQELRYTPNAQAQAVARGASNVVGLIIHDVLDPYFSSIAGGVMRQVEERELVVFLASTHSDVDRELEFVQTMRSHRVRALIICGSRTTDRAHNERLAHELEGYAAAGGQAAVISQDRLGTHAVVPQNRTGARALARELCRLGHRRFAVLAGPRGLLTSRDRLTGFREGLAAEGIDVADLQVLHGEFTREGGESLAARLIAQGPLPTCVFAVNDVMALGALAGFRAAGVRVPDDVSLAGFDDIAPLRDVVPSLTSVHLPLEEMGARAAQLALDTEPQTTSQAVKVHAEVVLRDSTRRLA